jgi:AraC-like DNA-binding protein
VNSHDCTRLRFSTDKLSPAHRLPASYEIFCHSTSRRYCSPIKDTCHVDIRIWTMGPSAPVADESTRLRVQRIEVTHAIRSQRTRELLSDSNDDLVLNIQETGSTQVSQCGREATAAAGVAILTSNADESTISFPAPTRFTSIALPRKLMVTLAPGVEDATARCLQPRSPVVPMLLDYLDIIDRDAVLQSTQLQRSVATHVHDLCALAIGASREAAEIALGRGLRAARLQALKADIAKNLTDSSLSAATLAKRHRVTPRYVHRLFESEGMTLSQFIRASRLALVHRNLINPLLARRTIGALAYDAGFGDLSTFNHEFRRRYGVTPSDLRTAAAAGVGAHIAKV